MTKNSIRVLINYSRSGGTLISRVLGSMPGVVLLSEVNPHQTHSPHFDVAWQMSQWYGVEVQGETFLQKVQFVYNWCNRNGKVLVLRDISSFDFLPNPTNAYAPSGSLQILETLQPHFQLAPLCFVRDAIDVWISRGCPPHFSGHYLRYVDALLAGGFPIVKFEDFCRRPSSELARICDLWRLEKDDAALDRYASYDRVTGDIQMDKPSRGIQMGRIVPLKRKRIPRYLQQRLSKDERMKEANRKLGYPESYFSDEYEMEQGPSWGWVELKFLVKRLLQRYPTHLE